MRKLTASMLSVAAAGGPTTVALAAESEPIAPPAPQVPTLAPEPPPVALELRARSELLERRAERRTRAKRRRERARRPSPALQAIAACESGGDPSAVGGGGAYRGKYQMSPSTWASVGGEGDPAEASETEQDRRAAKLYARSGASSWPACG